MSKPGIAATSIYMKRNTHLSLYWLAAWRLWWGSMPSLKTTSSAFPVLCLCSLSYCRSACFLALLSEFPVLPWEHVQRTQHRGLRLKSCFTLAFLVQFPELPTNSRELLFFFFYLFLFLFLEGSILLVGCLVFVPCSCAAVPILELKMSYFQDTSLLASQSQICELLFQCIAIEIISSYHHACCLCTGTCS